MHLSQRRCFLHLHRLWDTPLAWWAAIGMKGECQPRKVSRRPVSAVEKQLHSHHSLEEAHVVTVHMLSAFFSQWEGGQLMIFFNSLSKSINTLPRLDSSTQARYQWASPKDFIVRRQFLASFYFTSLSIYIWLNLFVFYIHKWLKTLAIRHRRWISRKTWCEDNGDMRDRRTGDALLIGNKEL